MEFSEKQKYVKGNALMQQLLSHSAELISYNFQDSVFSNLFGSSCITSGISTSPSGRIIVAISFINGLSFSKFF